GAVGEGDVVVVDVVLVRDRVGAEAQGHAALPLGGGRVLVGQHAPEGGGGGRGEGEVAAGLDGLVDARGGACFLVALDGEVAVGHLDEGLVVVGPDQVVHDLVGAVARPAAVARRR